MSGSGRPNQDSNNDDIQEQCAKAMLYLGVTYGQMTPPNTEKAIESFDDLIEKFKDCKHQDIQNMCLSARQNCAELCLILGLYDKTITLAIQSEQCALEHNTELQNIAIMYFIRYLASDNITITMIVNKIELHTAPDGYNWGFTEISNFIATLETEKNREPIALYAFLTTILISTS